MGSPSDHKYHCRNYINGRWVPSVDGGEFPLYEFNNPTQLIDTFPNSTLQDFEKALKAAGAAYDEFQKTSLDGRGRIFSLAAQLLELNKSKITDLVAKERGRPDLIANDQTNIVRETLKFFAGEFMDLAFINRFSELIPMSVRIQKRNQAYLVALNYGQSIAAAFERIIPILFSGNPVIFIPHERAASATALIDILVEAGFKEYPGALNLLHATAENSQRIMRAGSILNIF